MAKCRDHINVCKQCWLDLPQKTTIAMQIKLIKTSKEYEKDYINVPLDIQKYVIMTVRNEKAEG